MHSGLMAGFSVQFSTINENLKESFVRANFIFLGGLQRVCEYRGKGTRASEYRWKGSGFGLEPCEFRSNRLQRSQHSLRHLRRVWVPHIRTSVARISAGNLYLASKTPASAEAPRRLLMP
jgi:hypothetical protein